MNKIIIMGAIVVATLGSTYAQTANSNQNSTPTTDGTTKNSGTGNASNASPTSTGTSSNPQTGAVGSANGTSYGMQNDASANKTTQPNSSKRKERKAKRSKMN